MVAFAVAESGAGKVFPGYDELPSASDALMSGADEPEEASDMILVQFKNSIARFARFASTNGHTSSRHTVGTDL